MNYPILHELLDALEQFEKECLATKEQRLDDFLEWMRAKKSADKPLDYEAPAMEASAEALPLQGGTQAQITQLVVLMNKYMRYYLRKAFPDSPLHNPDDFGFLASLIFYGDMQKSELIQRNTSELTSGMEVIKRLERSGYVRSFSDPNDQRARRVAATDAGIDEFARILPAMQQIGQLAMGNLSASEQQQLFFLLNKLNHFHQPLFFETKKKSWEELLSGIG